ncbi:MAG: ATP-binding cassette domain-containing protein [Mycobacteriaceae bacterium]|nr:ATP-binding cassette domain-containing protein [Mycobacteriaceae bacterium]
MGRGLQGALLRSFGGRDHRATVTEVVRVAPHFVRITMSSPTIFQDVVVEPTAFLRFWFPDPEGSDSEFQRIYTLVWTEPESGRFAVDMVLHEPSGPASHWAASAEPGMTLPVVALGSKGFAVPEELPAGYLLIGDSASIPAINSILAALPGDVDVEVYLERHSPDDELIPINDHPRRALHWVDRTDELALAAAIEDRDWSNWSAWAGPEAGSLKHVRKRLRDVFGFPKSDLQAQAYWTQGREMGSRRDNEDKPAAEESENGAAGKTTAAPVPAEAPRGRWRSQAAKDLLAPVKPQLIATGILETLITLIQLAPFVVLVELARQLLAGAGESALRSTLIVFVVLLGTGAALSAALLLWLHVVDMRFNATVRRRLIDKLARVPLGWFTQRGSGAVKKLIQDDTLSLHYLVTHAVSDAVAAVVAPIAVLVYLFIVDWRLALVLLLPILVYLVTTWTMVYQSGPKITEASRWAERMNGEAAAYLEGQPVIRVFGGAAASSFRRRLDEYIDFINVWQRPFIGKKTFMDLTTRPSTFLWLIASAGTLFVVSGAMEPLTLLPFLILGTTFGTRLLGIAFGFAGLREGMQAARRIAVTLDEDELATMDPDDAPATAAAAEPGAVTFDNVGFGYRPGVPVIHDVTLALRPGTVTALVGPSGSGKSTLASLLARFHDVDSGSISIDGRDVRMLEPDRLYTQVGFVFQDVQLIQGTVRDNIALARPDASDADIEAAATDAQIHDRIMRLPNGYQTELGASSQLSGGERQRLTIARVLLADTPILILDEATAFADPESEYLVQQALSRLIHNRTVLVIAHRLHTITEADQIVVLDGGRIAEIGSHTELLAADGRYRQLWESRGETGPHAEALTGEATR